MQSIVKNNVFVSYSHKDTKWLQRLQIMLKPLIRNGSIECWDDTQIKTGEKWKERIEEAIQKSAVALLLVSPDFLASDFIAEHELPPLLNAAENMGVKIMWLPISFSLFSETDIGNYQAAFNPQKPLDSLSESDQNQMLKDVCLSLKSLLNDQVVKTATNEERLQNLKQEIKNSPPDNSRVSISHYFFYVSIDKLEKISSLIHESYKELDITIASTLNATTSKNGRSEQYIKTCEQLISTLPKLGKSKIQNLNKVSKFDDVKEGWAYAEIKLKVKSEKNTLLVLEGECNGYSLLLTCSEHNFIDYNDILCEINVNSTNSWFFGKQTSYLFRTHLWILEADNKKKSLKGTPLYLALPLGIL